ncbi:MAG: hypothetical protein ACOYA9_09700 [Bilifractor sp.]
MLTRFYECCQTYEFTAMHTEGVHELKNSYGWIARQRDIEQLAARCSTCTATLRTSESASRMKTLRINNAVGSTCILGRNRAIDYIHHIQ